MMMMMMMTTMYKRQEKNLRTSMPIQTTVPKCSYAADTGSLDKKDNTEVNTGLNPPTVIRIVLHCITRMNITQW